ncbi:hypothetical protein BJV78DRAFT_1285710 [Lactifluus subvellereus]|nr:hypothetical protein BJV78DRAFT_1285710 [Lactifluus subvellereus]
MSKERTGSRPDYITALALSRSHAENQASPKRLQPSLIPDLRFEPTYLARLEVAGPGWQSVVWVTVRDQVLNPLIQGALWGTASVFIQPLLRRLTSQRYAPQPAKEGSAAGWLRQWARSLFPDTSHGSPAAICFSDEPFAPVVILRALTLTFFQLEQRPGLYRETVKAGRRYAGDLFL